MQNRTIIHDEVQFTKPNQMLRSLLKQGAQANDDIIL
jgi:hypothetical protein